MYKNYNILVKGVFQAILFLCYYFSILFFVISAFVYVPQTYEFVYSLNGDSYDEKEVYIDELTSYFLFIDDLTSNWSNTELVHYDEVRDLYVLGVLFLLFSIFFLYSCKSIINVQKFSKISLLILSSHLLIFIDFNFFWDQIFHPLFFSNLFWIIMPGEISYILFDYSYFSTTLILIFSITFLLHVLIILKKNILELIINKRKIVNV